MIIQRILFQEKGTTENRLLGYQNSHKHSTTPIHKSSCCVESCHKSRFSLCYHFPFGVVKCPFLWRQVCQWNMLPKPSCRHPFVRGTNGANNLVPTRNESIFIVSKYKVSTCLELGASVKIRKVNHFLSTTVDLPIHSSLEIHSQRSWIYQN